MRHILNTYKPTIDTKIQELTQSASQSSIPWSEAVAESIGAITVKGKTIRGSLILLTMDLFTPPYSDEAVSIAACIEYLHTALLIHDDLIDHDDLRRGAPSMHKEYELIGEEMKVTNSIEFGKAMALCIGDIVIFGAFSLLSATKLPTDIHSKITQLITREFLLVGFGELQDVSLGYETTIPSQSTVLEMYTRKTARYTFSVPFMIGGILSNQPQTILNTLEKLGEKLGLLFQLTDDKLTLQGNIQDVGKTIGNDITENKKTLYRVMVSELANSSDKKIISQLFGKKDITDTDIQTILTLIQTYKVDEHIQTHIESLSQEAIMYIDELPISNDKRQILYDTVSFIESRKR